MSALGTADLVATKPGDRLRHCPAAILIKRTTGLNEPSAWRMVKKT